MARAYRVVFFAFAAVLFEAQQQCPSGVLQPRREQRVEVGLLRCELQPVEDLRRVRVVPARMHHDELRPLRRVLDHLDLAPGRESLAADNTSR